MRTLAGVLVALLMSPLASWAACNPSNAPTGSWGCQPISTSSLTTDTVSIWQPRAFPASANQIAAGNLSVTGNSVTNSLGIWMGYLAGASNPNPINFGGVVNFGVAPNFSAAPNFATSLQVAGITQSFPTSGLLVGTTDTQTLTNKTLTGGSLTGANVTGNSITNTLGTWTSYLGGVPNPNTMTLTLSGGSLSGANATGNGVTNTLGTWAGYLAGLPNPNPLVGVGASTQPQFSGGAAMIDLGLTVSTETTTQGAGTAFFHATKTGSLLTNVYPLTTLLTTSAYTPAGAPDGSAQDVAFNSNTTRNLPPGVSPSTFPAGVVMAQAWGSWITLKDTTQILSSKAGALLQEWDLTANNLDDISNRSGLSMILTGGTPTGSGGTPGNWNTGIGIVNSSADSAFNSMFTGGGAYGVAFLDSRTAVVFNGTITSTSGANVHVTKAAGFAAGGWPSLNVLVTPSAPATVYINGHAYQITGCVLDGAGQSGGTLTFTSASTSESTWAADSATGQVVFSQGNAIWIGTGNKIALDFNATTTISSDATTITLAATNTAVGALKVSGTTTMPLTTPASSSAACTAGGFAIDANFVYVCTATNVWKRAALSTF
jgi:hypothetical protein